MTAGSQAAMSAFPARGLSWTALRAASRSHLLPAFPQSSSLISSATAAALLSSGAVDYCLHALKSLLEHWKSQQSDEEPVAASPLLKPHTTSSPPDMSPFFLRQYVKVRAFPGQGASPRPPWASRRHPPGAAPKEPRTPLTTPAVTRGPSAPWFRRWAFSGRASLGVQPWEYAFPLTAVRLPEVLSNV